MMRPCSRRPVVTRPRRSQNYSRPWRRSDDFSTGLLGRTAPHGETLRPGRTAESHGSRATQIAAGKSGDPEPRGPRRGAAFHPALANELWNRHGLLSPRLVHDEVQPEIHGGTRGP